MKSVAVTAVSLVLLAVNAAAQGFIETPDGVLDDDAFFNVVSCGVGPEEICNSAALKWPRPKARKLGIRVVVKGKNRAYQKSVARALDQAVANINGVKADLKLQRVKGRGEITVFVTTLNAGETIKGTGSDLDGSVIEGAAVNIEWNDKTEIKKATIVMAGDLGAEEIPSIMLEELTQALGPINDIRNKAYEGVSIFSEDSNTQTKLGTQDIMVLRRLYQ